MKRHTYLLLSLVVIFVFGCICAWVLAREVRMGPPVSPDKKIIGWGADALDEIYLAEHVGELESLRPIDGVVISLYPDGWTGSRRHRNKNWFGGVKYSMSDFKQGIARLQNCKFSRFTDNFIDISASILSQRLAEWFDDDWESVVLGNCVIAAKIMREVGFKGLFIDTESYNSGAGVWRLPFSYESYAKECAKIGKKPRSLAQCKTQIRKRGRQFGQAITEVYPDITLFFIDGFNMQHQDLVVPFVDGVLEGAGPRVSIYNGGELGYSRKLYSSFTKLRAEEEANARKNTAVGQKLWDRVRYSFGIWVDSAPWEYGGFHTDDLSKNHKDGPGLEHTLYNALTVSDKYVWLYVWHPDIWWTPSRRDTNKQCNLCPHEEVPKPYINAIANCREPHDLAWTGRIQKDK